VFKQAQVQPQPATLPPSQVAPKEEKEKEKVDPLLEQMKRLDSDLIPLMKFCANYTSQIVSRVKSLGAAAMTDAAYNASFPTISLIQNKYIVLDSLLKGQTASIATPRTQLELPAPPSTLLNAASIFNSIQQLQTPLKTSLLTLSTKVANFANLIKQAQGAKKPWADTYAPKAASLQNAMLLAWELELIQKRITITIQSSLGTYINKEIKQDLFQGISARAVAKNILTRVGQTLDLAETEELREVATAFAQIMRAYHAGSIDKERYKEYCTIIEKHKVSALQNLHELYERYEDIYKDILPMIEQFEEKLSTKNYFELEQELKQLAPKKDKSIPSNMRYTIAEGFLVNYVRNKATPDELVLIQTSNNPKIRDLVIKRKEELDTKKASLKQAYPTMNNYRALGLGKKFDLDKWKKTAISMKSFARAYGKEYTFPQILYHFTKDWDMFERFDFKNWYNWKYRKANKENKMEKQADFVGQDRVQQFMNQRKKFMNRINLVRKALMELINSGLIMQNDSNKLYKIIAMLEFEATNLKAPKLAAARTRRAAKMLDKHGFTEGKVILLAAANELLNPGPLVRVADEKPKTKKDSQEAVELLRHIKREMDSLNYGAHLDSLFAIKKKLEGMNRQGDVEAIEKIIRDDLGSLEKLNKKLIEVYTNLSKVPLELSEQEDTAIQKLEPKQTAIETPLEVTEESKPELAAKPTVTPKSESARSATPVAPKPIAPARSAPAIQRNIPNV
jgi:hypothetical protein